MESTDSDEHRLIIDSQASESSPMASQDEREANGINPKPGPNGKSPLAIGLVSQTSIIQYLVDGSFVCGPCVFRTQDETAFIKHIEMHSYDCLYSCFHCPSLSLDPNAMTLHIKRLHAGKTDYYGCLVKPNTGQVLQTLKRDLSSKNQESISETARKSNSEINEDLSGASLNDNAEDDDDDDVVITGESRIPPRPSKNLDTEALIPTSPNQADTNTYKKLECIYKNGMYVCKSCPGTESSNYYVFAKHVYKHIHSGGNEMGGDMHCPFCKTLSHQPLQCTLVSNLMGLLQKQQLLEQESKLKELVYQTNEARALFRDSSSASHCSPFPIMDQVCPPESAPASASEILKQQGALSQKLSTKIVANGLTYTVSTESGSKGFVVSPSEHPQTLIPKQEKEFMSPIIIQPEDISPIVIEPDQPNEDTTDEDANSNTSKLLVKCNYVKETEEFRCGRCNFRHNASKPKPFRIHLWHEVHPSRTCNHCPPDIKFNKFTHCPIINQLMSHLMDAKANSQNGTAHRGDHVTDTDSDRYSEPGTPASQQGSDNDGGGVKRSEASRLESHLSSPEPSTPVSFSMQKIDSNIPKQITNIEQVPPESEFQQTISELNMPQDPHPLGEDETNLSQAIHVPVLEPISQIDDKNKDENMETESSTKLQEEDNPVSNENEKNLSPLDPEGGGTSEGLFVISNVISHAPSTKDYTTPSISQDSEQEPPTRTDLLLEVDEADESQDAKAGDNIATHQRDAFPGESSTSEDPVNIDQVMAVSSQMHTGKDSTGNSYSTAREQIFSKDYGLIYNEKKVSRASPYVWNRSRKFIKPRPPPLLPSIGPTGKVYVCSFYRCSYWSAQDAASFKIHNLLVHKGTRNYACAFCPRTFSTDDNLVVHVDEAHHVARRVIHFRHFQCGFANCWSANEREVDFIEHNQFNHAEEQQFPCAFCGSKYPSVSELTKHISESVIYVCVLCNKVLPTYPHLRKHVVDAHRMQANNAISVDSYIELCIKCIKISMDGQEIPKKISRFVYLATSPVPTSVAQPFAVVDETQLQESFKCTKCSLVTNDEAYFEEHVVQCMKSQTKKPSLLQTSKLLPQDSFPETVVPRSGSRRKSPPEERVWEGKDCEFLDPHRGPGPSTEDVNAPENLGINAPENTCSESQKDASHESASATNLATEQHDMDDNDDLPPLDPPQMHAKRKNVLQSLGKGSAVKCDKCTFLTEFRVVKAIHERIHLFDQDKAKFLWCPYCPYSTDLSLHFKIHIQGHQEKGRVRLYNCTYCILSSNQMDLVEDHHEEAHPNSEFKLEVTRLVLEDLQCPQCPASLKNELDFLEHLELEHGASEVQKYLKEMYAIASLQIVDDESLRSKEELVAESPESFTKEDMPVSTDIDEHEDDPEQGSERFQCPHCTYSCHKCGTWIRHLQRHVAGRAQQVLLYCCKTCKWKSTSKRKVVDHCKERHNEIVFEVQNVELSGGVRDSPEMTEVQDHVEPSQTIICNFHCDFCEYSTNEESILKEHMSTHEGQTASTALDDADDSNDQFQMEDNYMFGDEEANTSTDIIASDYNVLREKRQIIDDMLYNLADEERRPNRQALVCPVCPYSSFIKRNMRRHLQVHQRQANITNGFKCAYCSYISEVEGIVTKHIHKLHPDLPVKKLIIGNAVLKDMEQLASATQNENDPNTTTNEDGNSQLRQLLKKQSKNQEHETLGFQVENVWSQNVEDGDNNEAPAFTITAVVGSDGSTGQINATTEDTQDRLKEITSGMEKDAISENSDDEEGFQLPLNERKQRMAIYCEEVEGKDLFRCRRCVFMHQNPKQIRQHFSQRHERYCPYQCGYCLLRSLSTSDIRKHCMEEHKDVPVKILNLNRDDSPTLSVQMNDDINGLIETEGDGDYGQNTETSTSDEWITAYVTNEGDNVFSCNICGCKHTSTASLKHHILAAHLRYYPFKCKHCSFSAVEAKQVLRHTDRTHPELERKIIKRKIPEDLPVLPTSTERNGMLPGSINQKTGGTSTELGFAQTLHSEGSRMDKMNIKIKEEPLSDPEEEEVSDISAPHIWESSGDRSSVSPEKTFSVRDEFDETEDMDDPLYRPKKKKYHYPRQLSKIYRCGLCDYTSRWNLADVRLHVLCVHLRIHPYSCRYCCFGCPRRGKLNEHFKIYHPDKDANADEAKEEILSALATVEKGEAIYITLGKNAKVIENAYFPNVKARAAKAPGSSLGGRPRGSSSETKDSLQTTRSRRSCPSIYRREGDLIHQASTSKWDNYSMDQTSDAEGVSAGEQPLDLSRRTEMGPKQKSTLVPGKNTQVLKVPTTLRIPNIPKPYNTISVDRAAEEEAGVTSPKKQYTLYKCRSCGRGYVQKIKAQYHFALKHLNLHPYICNYCGFGENARKRVVDHILKDHPEKEIVVFAAFREHALVQKKVFPMKVDISEYEGVMRATKYISETGYLHRKERSDKTNLRCPQCTEVMANNSTLDAHMASYHQEYTGFRCSYCGVYIKAKQKMKYHIEHRHPHSEPRYQPIKNGSPYGELLTNYEEIVRKRPVMFGHQRNTMGHGRLRIAFPFTKRKPSHFGQTKSNVGKSTLGYADQPKNLVEDETLEMRVPTQPEGSGYGRSPPKMIKPRSDVVGGTVWLLCNHCSYTTLTSTLMRHHVMSHINYRPFKCPYCSFAGVRTHQVKKHLHTQHRGMSDKPKYVTDPETERTLTDHFTMKIKKANATSSYMKPYRLKHVPVSPLKRGYVRRASTKALEPPVKKIKTEDDDSGPAKAIQQPNATPKGENNSPESSESNGIFVCVLCGLRQPNRSSLLRHIMWELDYRPWHCPHCDYRDVTLFGVKSHSTANHPNLEFKMVLKQDHQSMSRIHTLVEQSKVVVAPEGVLGSGSPISIKKEDGGSEAPEERSEPGVVSGRSSMSNLSALDDPQMGAPQDSAVITSAAELDAAEKRFSKENQTYSCKNCLFSSTDKNCYKKHLLRHGPKRFKCGYCSQASVFKGELHKHLNRMHRKRPYKIVSLMENIALTKRTVTKNSQSLDIQIPGASSQDEGSDPPPPRRKPLGLSVNPRAEGGIMAMLEAELEEMDSSSKDEEKEVSDEKDQNASSEQSSSEPPGAPAPPKPPKMGVFKSKVYGLEDGLGPETAVAVIDGIVLTEEHLKLTAEGIFECQHCDYASPHRENSKIHVARHFPLRWQCAHCSVKHQLSYELRRHIRKSHPGFAIRMVRLKTESDFVPNKVNSTLEKRESPPAPSVNTEETVTEKAPPTPTPPPPPPIPSEEPYRNKPGPACSKRKRPPTPSGAGIPSVFCCFYCTFKTDNTLELVQHQKLHADGDKQGKSPKTEVSSSPTASPVAKVVSGSKMSPPAKILPGTTSGEETDQPAASTVPHKCGFCSFTTTDKEEFDAHRLTHTVLKPYKCAHCSYSGFVKSKVRDHCQRMHAELPLIVIAQEHSYQSSSVRSPGQNVAMKESWKKLLGPKYSTLVLEDVLNIPQPKLEHLLKVHQLIGINW